MRVEGDFLRDLEALGQQLSDPQSILTEVGETITTQMKSAVPVDTTDLRTSITYTIDGDQMTINMLYYGPFQNYGVGSLQTSPISLKPVEFGVNPRPRVEPFYSFQTRKFGLPSQTFFNMQSITDTIADAFATAVNEDFN